VWQAGTPGGTFSPYSCVNHIEEKLTGWQGPGCSPLQNGFMSACGCAPEGEGADCAAGESCGDDGRCVGAGGVSDCTCDPDDAAGCGAGRTCRSGACVKLCAADADCATGRVCEAGGCVPPLGVPTAEQIQWGLQNVTAPLHTIASYALSEIEALLRFKLGLYVEATIKLIKEKKWRLLDFARVYDLGSTRKLWFQPGLEARYQHTCTQAVGQGMTNRFPIAPTEALSSVLGFETPGVDPSRSCFLAGGVCRYPDDAAEWAALPPVDQRPEDFAQGNAGTLEDFVAWCKSDMPSHKEDPAPNTDDDLIDSVTDTWAFGQDVGMTLWAQNQMCVDGQVWTDWMAGLPDNFGDYDCVYDDPHTGTHHTFPCTELNEQMLLIWGCLSADAPPVDPAAAIALRDRFDGSPAPDITYLHPDFGTVFDPDALFGFTSVTYPDGSSALEFQYTYDAMLPAVRYYHGSFPFFSPNIGERWLRAVERCFDDRANDPAESACECATDDECNAQDGERCRLGRCESPHTDAAGVTVWTASQCPIVSLAAEVGPCCGDGTVENNGTYVEACDDGNTASGDGCSAACQVEEFDGPCHRDGAGACVNDCPEGKVCDADCNTCVAIEPPPCQLANGICGDKCPNGQVCDADCRACVDAPPRACGRNAAGVCENNCPDGEICDRACAACVSPVGGGGGVDPVRACQSIGDRCLDQCPDGRHCDDTCRACVADAVECAVNALGVCENQCPAGLVCDPTCTVCVDPPPAAECQIAAGQCLDACPEGQRCSPDCRGCVEAPPPCFPGPDGACGDLCPAGLECDALCQGCVRPVFAGPCFMDPDQPGLCIDECRPGQACDDNCERCVNVLPCSLENNVCTTNCPRGSGLRQDLHAVSARGSARLPLPGQRRCTVSVVVHPGVRLRRRLPAMRAGHGRLPQHLPSGGPSTPARPASHRAASRPTARPPPRRETRSAAGRAATRSATARRGASATRSGSGSRARSGSACRPSISVTSRPSAASSAAATPTPAPDASWPGQRVQRTATTSAGSRAAKASSSARGMRRASERPSTVMTRSPSGVTRPSPTTRSPACSSKRSSASTRSTKTASPRRISRLPSARRVTSGFTPFASATGFEPVQNSIRLKMIRSPRLASW
jgi:hypothetical protein